MKLFGKHSLRVLCTPNEVRIMRLRMIFVRKIDKYTIYFQFYIYLLCHRCTMSSFIVENSVCHYCVKDNDDIKTCNNKSPYENAVCEDHQEFKEHLEVHLSIRKSYCDEQTTEIAKTLLTCKTDPERLIVLDEYLRFVADNMPYYYSNKRIQNVVKMFISKMIGTISIRYAYVAKNGIEDSLQYLDIEKYRKVFK